jgi:hypothetical protein
MRSVAAFLLIFTFVVSVSVPTYAQKSTLKKKDSQPETKSKVIRNTDETRFDQIEAYTEGKGVWVRWRMVSERDNAGFYVYRMSKLGERVVSELIPGSSFKAGSQTLYDEVYVFFDPTGSLNSTYTIESYSMAGNRLRSDGVAVAYTSDIETIKDGSKLKAASNAKSENAIQVKNDPTLTSELKSEVQAGLVSADIDRHREVVAQPGARIAVKNSGLIRVSKAQLLAAGFDANADPTNWQLYLEGVERPIIVGPNSDYIEFFGKTLDTPESDIRMYYLIVGGEPGRRVESTFFRPGLGVTASRKYPQKFALSERFFYVNQILNGDLENYWGNAILSSFYTRNFNLSGIDRTAGTRTMKIDLQGYSLTPHSVEITLNGNVLGTINGSGRQASSGEFQVPVEMLIDGTNALKLRSIGAAGDISLFDRVTVDFPRAYIAENNRLDFPTDNYRKTTVSGFTTPNVRLFDVTYEDEPKLVNNAAIVQTNGTWGPVIPASRGRLYFAVGESVFSNPTSVTVNNPEVLRAPTHAATFVVISHGSLMTQAQDWANYRSGQGISTKVINVEEIYDEFNYGSLSSQAVEDFLEYAKNNWQTPPAYVLLVGDASVDSRNYTGLGYWNMVPTRMVNTLFNETGSDEALSDFNDDGLAELAIGRIASRTTTGVTNVLTKTITWEATLTPTSMERGALFTHDWPDGYDFEAMSNRIMTALPVSVPKISISQTSPTAQTDIINALNELDGGTQQNPGPNAGQYIVNYTGHGTATAWRNAGFFSSATVPSLTNSPNPTLFTALTCLNAYFVPAENNDSLAETLTKAPNGGAVAIWASTGLTTPDVQEIMATRFYQQISLGNITRMGDLIADAKGQIAGGGDVRLSWALLGDPMLKVR